MVLSSARENLRSVRVFENNFSGSHRTVIYCSVPRVYSYVWSYKLQKHVTAHFHNKADFCKKSTPLLQLKFFGTLVQSSRTRVWCKIFRIFTLASEIISDWKQWTEELTFVSKAVRITNESFRRRSFDRHWRSLTRRWNKQAHLGNSDNQGGRHLQFDWLVKLASCSNHISSKYYLRRHH